MSTLRLGEEMAPEVAPKGPTIREQWNWRQMPGWMESLTEGHTALDAARPRATSAAMEVASPHLRDPVSPGRTGQLSRQLTRGLRSGNVEGGFCSEGCGTGVTPTQAPPGSGLEAPRRPSRPGLPLCSLPAL